MILLVLSLLISFSIAAQPRLLAGGDQRSNCDKMRDLIDCMLGVDDIHDMEERKKERAYECTKKSCILGCCIYCSLGSGLAVPIDQASWAPPAIGGMVVARGSIFSLCNPLNDNNDTPCCCRIPTQCNNYLVNEVLLTCCGKFPDNRGLPVPPQQNM